MLSNVFVQFLHLRIYLILTETRPCKHVFELEAKRHFNTEILH